MSYDCWCIWYSSQSLCLKGTYYAKNNFYKVFEHSCVASVCENNQPVMVKILPLDNSVVFWDALTNIGVS